MDSVDGVPGLDHHTPGFALWLTLLQNHENKTVEMLLSFSSETERAKWVESVQPSPAVTGNAGLLLVNAPHTLLSLVRYQHRGEGVRAVGLPQGRDGGDQHRAGPEPRGHGQCAAENQ